MPSILSSMLRAAVVLPLFSGIAFHLSADPPKQALAKVAFAHETMQTDGLLKEQVWKRAAVLGGFWQHFPYDTALSQTRTEVMLASDAENLYVAAICYDGHPEKSYVIQSLKRDFSFPVSDAFNMVIDPWNDGQNGFAFGVNPMGAQREGSVEGGGNFGVTTAWDQVWYSAVTRHADRWIAEFRIPFRSLRFPEGRTQWKLNFARNNLKINETSTWVVVPRNFNIANLTFTGWMEFEQAPQSRKRNTVIIPYGIGRVVKNHARNLPADRSLNGGADAKLALSSSLNLDLTVNPDFAQVDVDVQQINLSRFSLFFPERRQFFIENSDLFGNFGFRQIRPFFSRNIGLRDGALLPISAGARVSGKIGTDWRIGAMSVQMPSSNSAESRVNYSVAAVQRKLFSASSISAIAVSRQPMNKTERDGYNRLLGVDYNLISRDSRWRGKFFYHQSFYQNSSVRSHAHASWLNYSTRTWLAEWNHEFVHATHRADVGFVPRTKVFNSETRSVVNMSYWRFEPIVTRTWYPSKGPFNNIKWNIYGSLYFDSSLRGNDHYIETGPQFIFRNTMAISAGAIYTRIRLYFPNDPTGVSDTFLMPGLYPATRAFFRMNSDIRRKLSGNFEVSGGGFYTGYNQSVRGEISYRYQPWGIFSLSARNDHIYMPAPYRRTFLTLVGAKAELSFTTNLYLTTFLQYNTQARNFNTNTRLQWRYRPMSDLFIVYSRNDRTANYGFGLRGVKDETLVVKLLWWLNT